MSTSFWRIQILLQAFDFCQAHTFTKTWVFWLLPIFSLSIFNFDNFTIDNFRNQMKRLAVHISSYGRI